MKKTTALFVIAIAISIPHRFAQLQAQDSAAETNADDKHDAIPADLHSAAKKFTAVEQPSTVVEGPEAQDLVAKITGHLVIAHPFGEITAYSIPAMQPSIVRHADRGEEYATIHALSGPDTNGSIAYIEDHFFVNDEKDRRHLLKSVKLDGTGDREIFSREGSAMWASKGEIGKSLALAPVGNLAAMVTDLQPVQMPQALLNVGKLEIWDIATMSALKLRPSAMDAPLSWFPDGKRLAYVRLMPVTHLPGAATGFERFGAYLGNRWDKVPAVYILDLQSGKSSFLHVGWVPIVSCDGETVLIGGWDNHSAFSWNRYDMKTKQTAQVKWPGDTGSAIAIPGSDLVLYWGLLTKGRPAQTPGVDGTTSPRPLLSIKAASIDSPRFQTIIDVDAKGLASFGGSLKK
jgi:hypothetical protein